MAALVIDHSAGRKSSEHPHEHRPAAPDTAPSRERVAMPPVEDVYDLADVREAVRAAERAGRAGKVLLTG